MNLGDPYFSGNGMMEQALKSKDRQMKIGKSDESILLGAWESHVHGEGTRKEEPDWDLFI